MNVLESIGSRTDPCGNPEDRSKSDENCVKCVHNNNSSHVYYQYTGTTAVRPITELHETHTNTIIIILFPKWCTKYIYTYL